MSFETECFSMYSDMSKRTRLRSLPNRKAARLRATSVLPTPVGPRKMNDTTGRGGFLVAGPAPLAAEQEGRQAAGHLGLAHPRRAQEDERSDGAVRILEAGPRPADGAG